MPFSTAGWGLGPFLTKKKNTIRGVLLWLDVCLIKALRNPRRTNGMRWPVSGHGRLCFISDCREQATPQRSRGARAMTSTLLPRNLEQETARRNSENILRISRTRPGRRPVRLETRWRDRADVAWDWNLTDLVGLGPVILKKPPAEPGAGWARRRRLGPARPHLRKLAPTAKTGGKQIFIFHHLKISRNVT